jgi:membrane protease YdiL (CAAX protease family)
MLTPVDAAAMLLLMVALPLYLHFVDFPRTRASILSGRPGARVDAYRKTIVQQWSITGLVLIGWVLAGRAWPDLRLAWPPTAAATWIMLGLVVLGVAFTFVQLVGVARTPGARDGVRAQFADFAWMLPHTRSEHAWFRVVSVTAGVCEEIVFRGYLLWGLDAILPLPGAVVLQALVFGIAHSYQGTPGIVKTGIVGLLMGAMAAWTGSLLAPIVIHAALDLSGGAISRLVFGDEEDARDQETARAAQSIK